MKTTFNYDHYFLYEELTYCLKQLEKQYPDLMKIESLGKTTKNRDVFAVTLSKGEASEKPAYYIDGNIHAGEVTGSMVAMHTIDYLLTNYDSDEEIQKLLEHYTFYIIPRISPDGAEVYLSSEKKLRSVDRPYLSSKQEDGLYDKDIDEDGVLRMMRVKTPYGAWKVHPENPLLMVKRAPDDTEGTFYNVYPEGQIEGDFDGHVTISKPLWGNDFNRNYPFGWYSEVRQPGAGPYPLSNMETKAVVDFVLNHPNIGGVMTLHTFGGMILCPPGTRPFASSSALDQKTLHEIGKMGTEETGYPVVDIFDAFTQDQAHYSSGAFDDWCYQQNGIPAYTLELWDMVGRAGVERKWPIPKKTDIEMAKEYELLFEWCQKHAPNAFKSWTVCQHPDLGEVEVGGLDMKFTLQNPPVQFLKEEIEKTTRFCLRMTKTLPQLTFDHIQVSPVGKDTYCIDVYIANKGYLPTYLTDETKKMAIETPIKVEMSSTQAMIHSNPCVDLGQLEGFSGIKTGYGFDHSISTQNHAPLMKKAAYYVVGKPGDSICVKATHPKAGTIETTIVLE